MVKQGEMIYGCRQEGIIKKQKKVLLFIVAYFKGNQHAA